MSMTNEERIEWLTRLRSFVPDLDAVRWWREKFDQALLESIEHCETNEKEYQRGLADGQKIIEDTTLSEIGAVEYLRKNGWLEIHDNSLIDRAYHKGVNDAWETARKMDKMLMNQPQFKECFDDEGFHTLIETRSALEIADQIKKYEAEKAEIEKVRCENCKYCVRLKYLFHKKIGHICIYSVEEGEIQEVPSAGACEHWDDEESGGSS